MKNLVDQQSMNSVLCTILEGTATETGEAFFSALVVNLAAALQVPAAWVTEYTAEYETLRPLAFFLDGRLRDDVEAAVRGTPCEVVVKSGQIYHVADEVAGTFPNDPDLAAMGMVSYLGIPFKDTAGKILGHLAVMDRKPMPHKETTLAIMRIFAARAAAEVRRIEAENRVLEREQRLRRLLDTAPDAIVELDDRLAIRLVNAEAVNALHISVDQVRGLNFTDFLSASGATLLRDVVGQMAADQQLAKKCWLPDHLIICAADGSEFRAEATLSRFDAATYCSIILILRNITERLDAEAKIRTLRTEADQLKEELKDIGGFDEIIGSSQALLSVLNDVSQVADTDATVLLCGETGTGKELLARMVHAASHRKQKPLIKLNCATIPAGLMESELFGHRRGAFTGATQNREGRFALADGGTLFLDEIAELPLELQSKLLRVLQEGEFEPVGSSQTRSVDVRVVAATNKDLEKMMAAGQFRQDLYYRLNVFPIVLPPLRDRGDDVILLATYFVERFARRMGRRVMPFRPIDELRLKSYAWPGNVRELQNVMERAVITAKDGWLDLFRCLPDVFHDRDDASAAQAVATEERILTDAQVKAYEKRNIINALKASNWRVSGTRGAARLLGLPSSTLNSRIKSLGIKRSD
ncbi:MAG: sigma 54-interacting transcriptional regulator [Desulfofustis sp.]|jgi:PAS domain S-box-containing protein|nr:sigma 54-interacting transcriptional regulator [Desulfofustis sp.]